ncbi:MAG: DNA-processing protein DprA [Candidatus Saccharimonadales bacterium]
MIVNSLKQDHPDFPKILSEIPQPPKQLFWQGTEPKAWLKLPKVAVVGSRKASSYGFSTTDKLASELAEAGVVIISGLAFGIDAAAHKAALKVGGHTVAVLPTALPKIYPAAHSGLARQILDTGGTLLSEYAASDLPNAGNFVARNRIVSGLSDGLLITEAAINSGSLHTARFALEQGKTVMAVPGNINSPSSVGANNLIKSGALPVTDVSDVFFALNIKPKAKNKVSRVFRGSPQEEAILKLIRDGTSGQEELAVAAGLDGPTVSSALTMLEIGGFIRPVGSGQWLST